MGIFGKLAFWKHETTPGPITGPELGLSKDLTGMDSVPTGMPGEIGQVPDMSVNPPTGLEDQFKPQEQFTVPPQAEPFQETSAAQPAAIKQFQDNKDTKETDNLAKNVELIASKVDTIRVILDQLSHKIENIEKIAMGEEEKSQQKRW